MTKNRKTKDAGRSDDSDITLVVDEDFFHGTPQDIEKIPPAFVCLAGPSKYQGKRWSIMKPRLLIGRTLENDIIVEDFSVSKSHAQVSYQDGEVFIADLESTNKTIINGRKIPPNSPFPLKNNDQIKIGKIILKFLEKGSLESVSLHRTWELRLRDPLTGIYNREALSLKAEEEFKRSELLSGDLSVIVFDLDHFKQVNDTFGHAAGDYVLKEMAAITKKHAVRSGDFFARFGGEEFIVILPDSSVEKALEVAQRIRKVIAEHDFTFDGQKISITISAGIACKGRGTRSWDDLFKKADKACYRSKQDGRNKITAL